MEFCPFCGILLQIDPGRNGRKLRLYCPVCPYVCPIHNKIVKIEPLVKKEVDPIFDDNDGMSMAPKTAVTCPRCHNEEVYFKQLQIRSAYEPMTKVYKCCNESCKHGWLED